VGLEPSRWHTPGGLWFSSDEARWELWKSPTESSSSWRRAGDLGHLQVQTAISSREPEKTTLQDLPRPWPSSDAMQRETGEPGKAL